jgi:hypothetical protein
VAYTIISQNNSTTTLSDGVNTITVPSRVNLTSGNFTIVEVNNNMATLEDGDGNVYRDIPCVATLAGEGGGGGSGLPDQTGNADKFLTTDGTDASWSDKPLVNNSTNGNNTSVSIKGNTGPAGNAVFVGAYSGGIACNFSTYVGYGSAPTGGSGHYNTCVGYNAKTNVNIGGCVQLGNGTNSENGTFYVGLSDQWGSNRHNYKMLDNDGTIPEARLADTTNAQQGQVLTLDNNNNAVWQTPSTAVTSTTATLAVADWSSSTQTITVNGVTSSNVVIVSPQPLSSGDYATAGVLCTAQNTNSLTFTCTQTPSNAIDLSIVIIG